MEADFEPHSEAYMKLKREALSHYPPIGKLRCVRCGFNDIRALTLDHLKAVRGKHRRLSYRALKAKGYPQKPKQRVYCLNCQRIKQYEEHEW